jgi:hypothetical protein
MILIHVDRRTGQPDRIPVTPEHPKVIFPRLGIVNCGHEPFAVQQSSIVAELLPSQEFSVAVAGPAFHVAIGQAIFLNDKALWD